jgi:isopentenyl-diphosphate delta-isomerase
MVDENELVILVNDRDEELGSMPKLEAHRKGALHRAFSVFVSDRSGRILLQRRADSKYHSGGLWTNTCCGHPRPRETTLDAASRRLREEMGISCELREGGQFTYCVTLSKQLVENEVDHVFVGSCESDPEPDPREVREWKWVQPDELREWYAREPDAFTAWFDQALQILPR